MRNLFINFVFVLNINNDCILDGVYFIVEIYEDRLELTEKYIKI